jgi:hypothetical protein
MANLHYNVRDHVLTALTNLILMNAIKPVLQKTLSVSVDYFRSWIQFGEQSTVKNYFKWTDTVILARATFYDVIKIFVYKRIRVSL